MPIVIDFTTAATPVEAPAKPRRPIPLNQSPVVQRVTVDRKLAVRVELSGMYGTGHWMLLDPEAWVEASATYGAAWGLGSNGSGKLYVQAARADLRETVRHPSGSRTAQLARLIMGAERGEAVIYINGNPLDLRRANLVKLSQAEAAMWRRERIAMAQRRAAA